METDITLVFIKYLIVNNKIDIEYLNSIDANKFKGSNIHKLITSLCINYVNLKSNIINEELCVNLRLYRNFLIHCEGSINSKKIKSGIIDILNDINNINLVDEYDEYNYMMYYGGEL